MRKSLALVLALVMLLVALPMLAVAEGDTGAQDGAPVESPAAEPTTGEPEEPTAGEIAYADLIQCGAFVSPDTSSASMHISETSLEDVILAGLQSVSEKIILPDNYCYSISSENQSIYMQAYSNVINTHPELFYVSNSVGFYKNSNNYTAIAPTYYSYDKSIAEVKSEYASYISNICNDVQSGWSDLEKALYLHDYIALNFEYDMRLYGNEEEKKLVVYDTYNLISQKVGVCQAYALLYMDLLEECGVSVTTVCSANHMWNYVQINDNWYHVDTTWDDPTKDKTGYVGHTYFLRSNPNLNTEGMEEEEKDTSHVDWQPQKSTAATYDNAFWTTSVIAPFVWLNNTWYCINENMVSTWDPTVNTTTEKMKISDVWYVMNSASQYWNGTYSGLSKWGGMLVYNTPSKIMTLDPTTLATSELFSPADISSGRVYGSAVFDNTLRYLVADTPGSSSNSYWMKSSTTLTPTVASLAVTTQPTGIFSVGESITWSSLCDKGLVLTATYNNLTTEVLTAASVVEVSPSSLQATAGTQTITLTYGAKSTTINLTVSGTNLITGVASDQADATLPESLSALTVSTDGTITVTPVSGNDVSLQVLVAAYDADGKMLEVKLVPITDATAGNAALTTTSTANKLSVFIVEPGASGKYAPVVAPLTWSNAA